MTYSNMLLHYKRAGDVEVHFPLDGEPPSKLDLA